MLTIGACLLMALSVGLDSAVAPPEPMKWAFRHRQALVPCLQSWEIGIDVGSSGLVSYRAAPLFRPESDPTQPESHRFQLPAERVAEWTRTLSGIELEAENCGAPPPPPPKPMGSRPARRAELSEEEWSEAFAPAVGLPPEEDFAHDIVFTTSGFADLRWSHFQVNDRSISIESPPSAPCLLDAVAQEIVGETWSLVEAERRKAEAGTRDGPD